MFARLRSSWQGLFRRFTVEHALLAGALLLGVGLVALVTIFASWATGGFGELRHEHQAVLAFALAGLGIQVIFTAFLVAIVGRPVNAPQPPVPSVSADPQTPHS